MELDKTTYRDLSIFQQENQSSLFDKLNFTRTSEGKEWLRAFFEKPFKTTEKIRENQEIIRIFLKMLDKWPQSISNGTLLVISKFYETHVDPIPSGSMVNAVTYRVFSPADHSLLKFSIVHFADFIRGMFEILDILKAETLPPALKKHIDKAELLLNRSILRQLGSKPRDYKFTIRENLHYGRYVRNQFRAETHELVEIYGRLDAWYSMAMAARNFNLEFPEILDSDQPYLEASGLYHLLLPKAVPYNIQMNKDSNFIFLTGANMAGKSTFIRAVGCAVFLAHLGMPVPATHMKLSRLDGLLSNINISDNILKGESYFYNEVQRIKNTILKINDGRKWLVLIDELFKGTNVQDAMKCSSAVIKGLIKIRNSIFILSTHLYEIADDLKTHSNISFKYFETAVNDDQLVFSYQLKDGVSNDRLGYLILKREKVVDLLEQL